MSFDVAAEAYDRFMGRYSAPLAVAFADWAGIGAGTPAEDEEPEPTHLPHHTEALDVGCGPGALTTVLAARLGAASVSAVDPSLSFVEAAQARIPWADVRHGVAEDLPFPDDRFDAALASLVVHFMTDPLAGVREMLRVTRTGGVLAVCVWDFEGGRAPQSLFFRALREATGHADDESDRTGARRGQLEALLRDAGCANVIGDELSVSQSFEAFDEWWEPYTLGVAPAGRQLTALDDDARRRVRDAAQALLPAGPFTVDVTAWAARGTA